MSNLIDLVDISIKFDGVYRLNSVNLSIKKGEFLIIAGCNGSGKTLLTKHINGLYPIKKGTLFFKGKDCFKQEKLMKKRVGIVFQNPDNQIVGLTVKDDIEFGPKNLGFIGENLTKTVNSALKTVEIEHLKHRNPHTLSGGEKKRVTIAGVLAMSPELIIFDEPFIGLDYPGVISVTKSIRKLIEMGETIVIITHDLEKILAYANRVVVMSEGSITDSGTPAKIIDNVEKWGIRRPIQKTIEDMTWLK